MPRERELRMRVLALVEELEVIHEQGPLPELPCRSGEEVRRLDALAAACSQVSAIAPVCPAISAPAMDVNEFGTLATLKSRGSPGALRMVRTARTIEVGPTIQSRAPPKS